MGKHASTARGGMGGAAKGKAKVARAQAQSGPAKQTPTARKGGEITQTVKKANLPS